MQAGNRDLHSGMGFCSIEDDEGKNPRNGYEHSSINFVLIWKTNVMPNAYRLVNKNKKGKHFFLRTKWMKAVNK